MVTESVGQVRPEQLDGEFPVGNIQNMMEIEHRCVSVEDRLMRCVRLNNRHGWRSVYLHPDR